MINIFKLLAIFAYTVLIFFFSGYRLVIFATLNIVAMIAAKISPVSAFKYITTLLPFIGFACIFNLVLGYTEEAINLALRLVMICNIPQCYKKTVSSQIYPTR